MSMTFQNNIFAPGFTGSFTFMCQLQLKIKKICGTFTWASHPSWESWNSMEFWVYHIYPESGRIFQSFNPERLEPFSAHIGQKAPSTVSPNNKGSTQMLMMLGFKKHLVLFAELRFELTRCAQRETAPGQAVVHNGCLQVKTLCAYSWTTHWWYCIFRFQQGLQGKP